MRRSTILTGMLVLCLAAAGQAIESTELDPPLKVLVYTLDNREVTGRMTAVGPERFTVQTADGEEEVNWSNLDGRTIYLLHMRALRKVDGSPEDWLDVGRLLLKAEDGEKWADRAFRTATKTKPALEQRVAEIREQVRAELEEEQEKTEAEQPAGDAPDEPEEPDQRDGPDGPVAGDPPSPPKDMGEAEKGDHGPRLVGSVQREYWGELSADHQAAAVKKLKDFAERTEKTMGIELDLYETDYFLFYTDLPAKEGRQWSSLLDKMYVRLSKLFALDPENNIFRGKGLILVFEQPLDYHRFQRKMHGTVSTGSAGMCHSYGNGMVHIAFYKQPEENRFAHVLVHESVHGFLHRYRSPERIDSWINEGLAETIAHELVPRSKADTARQTWVWRRRRAMWNVQQGHRHLQSTFFAASHISGWEYALAQELTGFMIQQNRKGFAHFINGIKNGEPWTASLEKNYGAPLRRIVDAYAASVNIPNVPD